MLTIEVVKREKERIEDELDKIIDEIDSIVSQNYSVLDHADDIRLDRIETDFHRNSDTVIGGALIKYRILM